MILIKKCEVCNKQFKTNRVSARFCSTSCFGRNKKITYIYKKCLYCNKEIKIKKGDHENKYCSKDCFHKYIWKYTGNCYICNKKIKKGKYCIQCVETRQVHKKIYYKKDWLKERKRQWNKKLEIIKILGGKCRQCGIDDIRVLDINHLIPENKTKYKKGGHTTPRRLKDWLKNIKDLELLCANCHRIYTWEQMKYGLDLKL